MSQDKTFSAVADLAGTTALAWAADCVEHLMQRVGDTPNKDVAASIALARKFAQERTYDPAAAHALSESLRQARGRLSVSHGGPLRTALASVIRGAIEVELLGDIGWEGNRIEGKFEPLEHGESDFSRRERALNRQLSKLLRAAESLCEADPHVAARDASAFCRKAVAAEELWQVEHLQSHLQPPPSVNQAATPAA